MTRDVPALVIPPHLQERQTRASDPRSSVWVSANAGSGKTHVLTQRVIRLLLTGVAPSKILCLTFTKAAAAQMAQRVFDALSHWTQLDDGKLRAAIVATGAPPPTSANLLRARRLFTRTVETPGGLKIQTIHAFCERLLHLFPFEANVPSRFEVADERRTEEMLALAKRDAVADMQGSAALAVVADIAGQAGVDKLIAQSMKPRKAARRVAPDEQARLADRLGFEGVGSADDVRREMIEGGLLPSHGSTIAEMLATGLKSDREHAHRMHTAAALYPTDVVDALTAYLQIFFDKEGHPRSRLMTKDLAATHPTLHADLQAEQHRLSSLQDRLKVAETIERTQGLVELVDAVLDRYDQAKAAQGLLDFDDLIDRTLVLLNRSDSGWIQHKLDAGVDHVLVDEAQDTSEAQWTILERLTGDFASGETARGADRSFFVVGDDKQSIFSFQGAAPLKFHEMRGTFERRFKAGLKAFERVELKTSFRSVPGVLDAVDTIFKSVAHQDGLVTPPDVWPVHESIKARLPGLVEIWPRLGAVSTNDPDDWMIPVDLPSEHDPVNVVADRVAKKIKSLIAADSLDVVHDGRSETPRRIRPGDILVLVRTRGAFFEAVIRALKRHYVPVAGADRLDVANHIAVMDLVAAGRAALLLDDDLGLACLLKSPLFGLTDDDLIVLAPERRGPLSKALSESSDPRHREAYATIHRWSARAVTVTPFAFYAELLGRDGGRRLMEARLGPEAHDAIDEFLRLALAHERQGAPSLGSFLTDVEALQSSIRRDMDAPGELVRVMTVHAAKGLEAKIVFLPDTCAVPAQQLDPTVFDLNKDTGRAPLLVWSPRKSDDTEAVAQARIEERKATMREYRRLLYVALTRAEERLYVAGYYNLRSPPDDCWERMIDSAFPDAPEVEAPWGEGDVVKRIISHGSIDPVAALRPVREQGNLKHEPVWLRSPVEAILPTAPLRPSRLRRDKPTADHVDSLRYGSELHLLLQYLPEVSAAAREATGRAFLEARRMISPARHESLLADARAVMAMPELAALFGPDAKAEVAVIGRVACPDGNFRDVRGSVDRIVAATTDVIAADFKTGSPQSPPPAEYVEQMALYQRVLGGLWPGRPIKMLLVWTAGPKIIELNANELDRVADAVLSR